MNLQVRFPISIVSAVLAFCAGPALAGEDCGAFDIVTHIFDVSDTDGSGSLSRQEYLDAGLDRYGVPFDEYDADGDGEASIDEYVEMYDRYHLAEGELET